MITNGRRAAEARPRFYVEASPDYVATAERELPGIQRAITMLAGTQSLGGRDVSIDGQDVALEEVAEIVRSLRSRLAIKRKAQEVES